MHHWIGEKIMTSHFTQGSVASSLNASENHAESLEMRVCLCQRCSAVYKVQLMFVSILFFRGNSCFLGDEIVTPGSDRTERESRMTC